MKRQDVPGDHLHERHADARQIGFDVGHEHRGANGAVAHQRRVLQSVDGFVNRYQERIRAAIGRQRNVAHVGALAVRFDRERECQNEQKHPDEAKQRRGEEQRERHQANERVALERVVVPAPAAPHLSEPVVRELRPNAVAPVCKH